jgi:hypothetical protein
MLVRSRRKTSKDRSSVFHWQEHSRVIAIVDKAVTKRNIFAAYVLVLFCRPKILMKMVRFYQGFNRNDSVRNLGHDFHMVLATVSIRSKVVFIQSSGGDAELSVINVLLYKNHCNR